MAHRSSSFVAHAVGEAKEDPRVALVEDGPRGLVIADQQARPQYASLEAWRLLFLSTHAQVDARALAAARYELILPAEVVQVCKKLIGVFEGKQPVSRQPDVRQARRSQQDRVNEQAAGNLTVAGRRPDPAILRLSRALRRGPGARRCATIILQAASCGGEQHASG